MAPSADGWPSFWHICAAQLNSSNFDSIHLAQRLALFWQTERFLQIFLLERQFKKMQTTTILGFIAGTLTTISFVPQVLKAWRTKRCDDLSLGMLLSFAAGISL